MNNILRSGSVGAIQGQRSTSTATRALSVWLGAVLAAVALLAGGTAPVLGDEALTRYDDPDVRVTVAGSDVVTPGETTTLDVQLQNRGGTVGDFDGDPTLRGPETTSPAGAATATAIEVEAGDAPVTLRSGEQAAGTIPPDGMARLPVTIEVDDDAPPGTYDLPVRISYDYLHLTLVDPNDPDDTYQSMRSTETVTRTMTVRVDSHVDPDVRAVSSDLAVGSEGTVTVAVTNDGSETARDPALVLRQEDAVTASDPMAHVGELPAGETARASYRVAVSDDAGPGPLPLTFVVEYADENGVRRTSPSATASVDLAEEARIDVDVEPVDLYVDSVGGVRVTVANEGDETLEEGQLVLRESPPFAPVASRTAVGDLAPGESVETTYRVEVSDRAVAGDYPLDFALRYRNGYGDAEETGAVTAKVPVGPERDFAVAGDPPVVSAGATETATFRFRNTGPSSLEDAVARINADAPFSTDDDTSYLGDLDPGETANATFRVTVDGGATPKTYSMDAEIKYQNGFGDRVVTDLEEAPVRVQGGGGLIAGLLSAVAGLLP